MIQYLILNENSPKSHIHLILISLSYFFISDFCSIFFNDAQDRDAQKTAWLDKCVDELKSNSSWVLPVLKHMRDICMLYDTTPVGAHQTHTHTLYR